MSVFYVSCQEDSSFLNQIIIAPRRVGSSLSPPPETCLVVCINAQNSLSRSRNLFHFSTESFGSIPARWPRSSQSFLLSTLTLLLTSWFLLCILYIWDLFFWGRGGGGTKAEHSYWGTSGLKSWITLINLLNLTINFLEQDKERTSQNTTYNAVLCISVTFQEKSPLFGNIFIAFLSLRKWFGP